MKPLGSCFQWLRRHRYSHGKNQKAVILTSQFFYLFWQDFLLIMFYSLPKSKFPASTELLENWNSCLASLHPMKKHDWQAELCLKSEVFTPGKCTCVHNLFYSTAGINHWSSCLYMIFEINENYTLSHSKTILVVKYLFSTCGFPAKENPSYLKENCDKLPKHLKHKESQELCQQMNWKKGGKHPEAADQGRIGN